MFMKVHVIAAATLIVGATTALAQDGDQQQSTKEVATQEAEEQAQDAEDDRGDEVVCRTERVTGSLTRRTRTCLTRNEWNDIQARTRDEVNKMTSTASGGVECRGNQFGGC
jgi:hypothetical protein